MAIWGDAWPAKTGQAVLCAVTLKLATENTEQKIEKTFFRVRVIRLIPERR